MVGQRVLGRMRKECEDFADVWAGQRIPQLQCLCKQSGSAWKPMGPPQLQAEAGSSASSVGELVSEVRRVRARDSAALRGAMAKLLAAANSQETGAADSPACEGGSTPPPASGAGSDAAATARPACIRRQNSLGNQDPESGPRTAAVQVQLERMAGSRALMEHEYLMSCALSSRGVTDLRAVNPTLSRPQAKAILRGVVVAMLRASRISQCNRVIAMALSMQRKLSKLEGRSTALAADEADRLLQQGQRLAATVSAVRHYTKGVAASEADGSLTFAEPEGAAGVSHSRGAVFDTRYLVFEFLFGWILRQRQVELVDSFAAEARREVSPDDVSIGKNSPSSIYSALMGIGKTAAIGPLASLLLADGNTLVTQVAPAALIPQTAQVLYERFTRVIPKRIIQLQFNRGFVEEKGIGELKKLRRKLKDTQACGGIVLSDPTSIKSLMLVFIEAAGKGVGTDGKSPRHSATGESSEQHAKAAEELAQILDMFSPAQKGLVIMDEVDALLNSMTSECNYPISSKKNLEPRPERWELPIAILDVLCRATDAAAGRSSGAR